jgi:hypothetical protein
MIYMAGNFHNVTGNHKFTGTFIYKELDYEYVLYLPRFNPDERLEVISKFGNRMQGTKFCLDIKPDDITKFIDSNQVSAYVIVNQVGSDETASGTLQIYNWCPKNKRKREDNNEPLDYPLVWINDVCRITVGEQAKLPVSPVGALFFVMEQLTLQNLGKTDIYLFVDKTNDTNKTALKNLYSTKYGFILNSEDHDLCRNHKAGEHLMVMKKPGLENNSEILNLSFLGSATNRRRLSGFKKKSFLTTSPIVTGGKKNMNRNKKTKRNRKIKRKHNHSKRHALKKSF